MLGVTRAGPMPEGTSKQQSEGDASGDASPEPAASGVAQVIVEAGGSLRVAGALNVGNQGR